MNSITSSLATIMIVDDTPLNLKLLQELLQEQGYYRTVAFPDGAMALQAAAQNPPDLILLDIVMPNMDGFEVCRRLKADPALREIPILFISALNATEDKVRAFALGGVDYITKPFQPEEVYARVGTQLRLRRLLQASEQRQTLLINELPDVIMRFDRARRHVFVSGNITEIGPLVAESYIGRTHEALGFDAATCRFWEDAINRVFNEAQPFEAEYLPQESQPQQVHNLRIVPERNVEGRIESVLALSRDISLHKEAERALIAARQAAEAANRAKSEFLANMSHEIRTPMNGIIGLLGVLRDEGLTPDQESLLNMALSSAQALTALLGSILDMADLEHGQSRLQSAQFSSAALLDSILDFFAPSARQKGIKLSRCVEPGTPDYLIGDAARLQQILFNLLGNAVKFTTSGTVRLTVTPLPVRLLDRVWVRFSVADTGIGIAPEVQAAIWEPFAQADSSSTRQHQGAGLGLTLVQRSVELLEGRITLYSTPGIGTTVNVDLPFMI